MISYCPGCGKKMESFCERSLGGHCFECDRCWENWETDADGEVVNVEEAKDED